MHLFTVPSKSSIILSYAVKPGLVGSTNAAALDTLTSTLGSSSVSWTAANLVLSMDGDDTAGPAKAYFLNDDSSSFRNLNDQRLREREPHEAGLATVQVYQTNLSNENSNVVSFQLSSFN